MNSTVQALDAWVMSGAQDPFPIDAFKSQLSASTTGGPGSVESQFQILEATLARFKVSPNNDDKQSCESKSNEVENSSAAILAIPGDQKHEIEASSPHGSSADMETAIDNILDPLQSQFESVHCLDSNAQANLLHCAWHMLHAIRAMLVRRSHLFGANVRSHLRALLTATAQYAASFNEPQLRWSWDFRMDPTHIGPSNNATPQAIAMATAELLTDVLAASTIASRNPQAIGSPFLPMPTAASNSTDHEQIAAFLCLGRMAVLVTLTHNKEAVAAVAPIIISHITQVLTTADDATKRCSPCVYACAVQTLARCAPYLSEHAPWATERALSILLRAYQCRTSGLGQMFLFNSPSNPTSAHAEYQGALADALEDFALGYSLVKQPQQQCLAFAHRLLAHFSAFGLANDLDACARDLVGLLPAVANACASLTQSSLPAKVLTQQKPDANPTSSPAHKHSPSCVLDNSIRQPSVTLYHNASVMATVEALCKHDGTAVKLFRNVWLYCGMMGLRTTAPRTLLGWPRLERCMQALGLLAAHTPVLMYGTGVAKEREGEQRVQLEMLPHLAAAGSRGSPEAIAKQLRATVTLSSAKVPIKNTSNAFLLAIATLELSRAEIGPLPVADAPSPLVHPLAYVAGAHKKGVDRSVFKALTGCVFDALTMRLTSVSCRDCNPLMHLERLADVLIRVISWSDQELSGGDHLPNKLRGTSKSRANGEMLLARLLTRAPSLYYSLPCITSWVVHGAGTAADKAADHLCEWLAQAASRAPTHCEHLVQRLVMASDDGVLLLGPMRPSRLVDAVADGRAKSRMEEVTQGNVTAVYDKSVAIGRVAALLDNDLATEEQIAVAAAQPAASPAAHKQLCLDTAALIIIKLKNGHMPVGLIETLCQLPLGRFEGAAMRDVVFAWHWVAAESGDVRDALVTHMLPVWEATIQRGLGLFGGPWTEPSAPLSSGDLHSWDAFACAASLIDALRAHHLWILFLTEAWQSSRHAAAPSGSDSLMLAFLGIFRSVVASKAAICTHPLARPTLFRLLSLAVSYCTHLAKHAPEDAFGTTLGVYPKDVLGDVLELALCSFAMPQRVTMPDGSQQPQDTINALSTFCESLKSFQVAKPDICKAHEDCTALLMLLLQHELQLLAVLHTPLQNTPAPRPPKSSQLEAAVKAAWQLSPALAAAICNRFPACKDAASRLAKLVLEHSGKPEVQAWPPGASVFIAAAHAAHRPMTALSGWTTTSVVDALQLLAGPSGRKAEVREYVMRSLSTATDGELVFWLPQMLQSLRHDDGRLARFLRETALEPTRWMFLHKLIWALDTELRPAESEFNPKVKRSGWQPPRDTGLWGPCATVKDAVLSSLGPEQRAYFENEHGTFQKVTDISGILKSVPKEQRRDVIAKAARQIAIPRDDLYLPVDPHKRLVSVIPESGTSLQSAAKTPILLAFNVEVLPVEGHEVKAMGGPIVRQSCIFKVGDDCRQDVLALQIFTILRNAFKQAGLPLYVNPYGVLPTGYERGIIQVVPDTKSRASLGEISDGGLYELFQSRYGAPGTRGFEEARDAFIVSQAGYAVASFIVQSKDRHNGNILLDSKGHIVHIDFGFIFEISPGGNLGFERAAFKFSHEMVQLIDPGGQKRSTQYQRFKEYCVRGFLAARTVASDILALATLMSESGLPCYSRGRPVHHMRERFLLEKEPAEAAAFMRKAVDEAHNSFTTGFYDYIQVLQQGIPY